jgi:hypothetical protein
MDKLFDPRICFYRLDPETRAHVESLAEANKVLAELLDEYKKNKNKFNYESLTKLHKYIQRSDPDYPPFYVLQDKCKCYKPKPRENRDLEMRLQRLRLRDSQNCYEQATVGIDRSYKKDDSNMSTITQDVRAVKGSVVAVFNSFLVYICTFIFCYKALEYAIPEPNIAGQVLFGLFGSTVVACAELYFLARVV